MTDSRVPRSRTARGAAVARLAGETVARNAATKAANLTRGPEARRVAVEQRHVDAAEQIVNVLGTMKGAAMKLGQMLSVIDLGFLPEGDRERFQQKLAALRDSAPSFSFAAMQRVLEKDIGPVSKHFADIDPEPIAAASIGQVFRGHLKDGREVAIKIQYPGIGPAVRADLKNLGLILKLARNVAPGVDFDALVDEVRTRMTEELDYRQEAANQRAAAELFAGHPFIHVPGVIDALCGERVLVMEFVTGARNADIETAGAEVRDRVGEILYRFYCGSMYRLGQFSGDPHPGNYLLMQDGRVAFLDFGLYKHMDAEALELQRVTQRAALDGDISRVRELMIEAGILQQPELVDEDALQDYMLDVFGWYLRDETLTLAPEAASRSLLAAADPRSAHFGELRYQHLPPEHLIARRTEAWVLGLLGQLRATGNWHRIAREWLLEEDPQTELGRQEAAFYAAG